SPGPICPTTRPSTRTEASETRWITARMAPNPRSCRHPRLKARGRSTGRFRPRGRRLRVYHAAVSSAPARIGRYRILGLVGQGAMGRVYRGRDESLERDVAVKVMSLGPVDADARARFEREAKAAARLQHPNIVTIYELGWHEGSPFMALELLEGS